jgi:hypothetical protein
MLRNGFRILAIRWKRLASIFTDPYNWHAS